MPICKLCLQNKKLLKKSHIIPDFMYKELYDKHHRIYSFNPMEMVNNTGKIKLHQSGVYEGNILCENCDNVIISQYENYGRYVLKGGNMPPEQMLRIDKT